MLFLCLPVWCKLLFAIFRPPIRTQRMPLHRYPFLRLLLPYMGGVLLAELALPEFITLFLALVIVSFVLVLTHFFLGKAYSTRWVFGFFLSLGLIGVAVLNVQYRRPIFQQYHLANDTNHYQAYFGRVTDPPVAKEKSTSVQLQLIATLSEKGIQPLRGNCLVYLSRTEDTVVPAYGQIIGFYPVPQTVPLALNPHQFDYKTYLSRKQVFNQVFLKSEDWFFTSLHRVNPLYDFSFRLRDYLLLSLKDNHLDDDTFGVAAAILLGYDEKLPAWLRQGYTAAGAMHVLCVSGLHVGIVFMFFNFFLGLVFRKGRRVVLVKTLILLSLIWFYALLTGLSPSVQRAAVMISFMLIGKLFRKKGFVLNSMAASAFFILLVDPLVLFNIGFQLSYLAVLGIVLLHKPVYSLLYFKYWLPDKAWEISAVAIAAQLATTPLVLYYFSQFPTYFLVSNLVLVPLSFVVIVAGMALLIFTFIPFIANYLGWLTWGLIYVMNSLITSIESWPAAVLKGNYLNSTEAMLLMLLIALLYLFFVGKKKHTLIPALFSALLILVSISWRNYANHNSRSLVIYGINRHTAIDVIQGNQHLVIVDSALKADPSSLHFNVARNWVVKGLSESPRLVDLDSNVQAPFIHKSGMLLRSCDKTILLWNKDNSRKFAWKDADLKTDVLLVSGNVYEKLEDLSQRFNPSVVVIDLSVPGYQATKWKAKATQLGLKVHDIRDDGAFILEEEI